MMPELLAGFTEESKKTYLSNYYESNLYNEDLEQSEEGKYIFLSNAVQFLQESYDVTSFEGERIGNYVNYLYQMMMIDVNRNEMEEALNLGQKAISTLRLWMENEPDNQEAAEQFQYIFSELSILQLIAGKNPTEIKSNLLDVLNKTGQGDTPMLALRLGHCELILGNTAEAYSWYNSIMNNLAFVTNEPEGEQASDFIATEIGRFLPGEAEVSRTNLGSLNQINFYIKDAENSEEVLNSKANADFTALSGQKDGAMQYWLDKSSALLASEVIVDSTHQYILNEAAKLKPNMLIISCF